MEAGLNLDDKTGQIELPRAVRRVKIDVGLAFNAPNSQIWLDRDRARVAGGGEHVPLHGEPPAGGDAGGGGGELLVFGFDPNLEAVP